MYYFPQDRLAFFHIPKTGGSSFRGFLTKALRRAGGPSHTGPATAATPAEALLPYLRGSTISFHATKSFATGAAEASRIKQALLRGRVDHRFWYEGGLHRQSHFSDLPHEGLDVTDDLAPRLLGLPMAVDLSEASIAQIADALLAGVARA